MGPVGTRSSENRSINKNSTPGIDHSPPSSDECNGTVTEDECLGDTVPYEENDVFDTQLVDFDNETQAVDLYEDTQILYLAAETQEMDDFDLDDFMDTQMLDVSDNENDCESGEQGAERTQLLDDSKEFLGRNGCETGANEKKGIHACHQDDKGAKTETLPPNDAVQSSGSLRKGFTAIRTASLRAAGLAAQKMVSKNADYESCSTEFSSKLSNLQHSNDCGGISDIETVDLEHDTETDDEKGLSNGCKSKVARSLAKELFMKADVADGGLNNSHGSEMTSLPQLPACDNEVAGLSYVDSQEPGELSQANALEFVDRFLKINVLESDQDVTNRNASGEMLSPDTIAKVPQCLVQQAKCRSSLVGASVFDWDDRHEDEGGGEFFTKKKEVLFGTPCDTRKSCIKAQNSKHQGPNGSQSLGKLRNEEHQNMHDKTVGLVHSDSKVVKSRKTTQVEEFNKKGDDYPHLQGGLPSCNKEVLGAAPNAISASLLNVGIDTQMAAEAMEALSTGLVLATDNGSIPDEEHHDVSRREVAKKTLSKKSSVEKRRCLLKSGTTKSKRTKRVNMKAGEESKSSVAFRTRSQFTIEESNIDMVKPKVKHRRRDSENIAAMNERESLDRLVNVGQETVCALEGKIKNNESLPLKRQSLQDKASVSAPVARKTRLRKFVNHVNGANDELGDSKGKRQCLNLVQSGRNKTKCSSSIDFDSDNLNAREETLNVTTGTDSGKIASSKCRGKRLRCAYNKVNGIDKKQSLLRASGGHEVVSQTIAWQTRSKRSARCVELPQAGKGLRSGVVVSSEDSRQLSSEEHQVCSPANEVGRHREVEQSPVQVQTSSSSLNITPVNLKTALSTVSPLCVGDGYLSPSCKSKRSLSREFYSLTASEPKYTSPSKDLRQRRDFNSVRVLFSQHLDNDIIRKQKKILFRLGVPMASSILDATHFVADMFVRTRNMLEAIARGKPVVTHLWLESCGQSNCFIDEKNYILRDAKKEKELGFSMPNSLAHASHYPVLKGRRVLVTPNVKPSKDIISGLVNAVHGQAIERLYRFMSNNNRLPDDLLVLSCEEDMQECIPLLEKGIAVYSSELLLNGIITQRLEYERYGIFVDQVKRTRSTLWVKKNGDKFLPVTVKK